MFILLSYTAVYFKNLRRWWHLGVLFVLHCFLTFKLVIVYSQSAKKEPLSIHRLVNDQRRILSRQLCHSQSHRLHYLRFRSVVTNHLLRRYISLHLEDPLSHFSPIYFERASRGCDNPSWSNLFCSNSSLVWMRIITVIWRVLLTNIQRWWLSSLPKSLNSLPALADDDCEEYIALPVLLKRKEPTFWTVVLFYFQCFKTALG